MFALDIENLSKVYRRGFWGRPHMALDGLTLQVEQKEVFGFIGANGAGKTTTFKILMGLLRATGGTARILGAPIGQKGVRRTVGFLPEDAYFYTYLTGRELLTFYGRLQGLTRREASMRVDAILETVGLARAARVRLGEYSKGMRQRFGVAQAIVNDPTVLFLDEPLTGLDPLGRKDLKDLILSLRDRGKTVFFSSHILSDAEAICDRIAVLHEGRLVAKGQLGELLQSRIRSYELQVTGIDTGELAMLGLPPHDITTDGKRVYVNLPGDEDPDRWIGRIRDRRGRVAALIPYRESLEAYFVRTAQEEPAAAPPAEGDGPDEQEDGASPEGDPPEEVA